MILFCFKIGLALTSILIQPPKYLELKTHVQLIAHIFQYVILSVQYSGFLYT